MSAKNERDPVIAFTELEYAYSVTSDPSILQKLADLAASAGLDRLATASGLPLPPANVPAAPAPTDPKEKAYCRADLDRYVPVTFDEQLARVRLGLRCGRADVVSEALLQAHALVSKTPDFERKNKLKVYRAVSALRRRDWAEAGPALVAAAPTFTSSELLGYDQLILYASVATLLSGDRRALAAVLRSPDFRQELGRATDLRSCLDAFYYGHYAQFMQSLARLLPSIDVDWCLGPHAGAVAHTARDRAYGQYLSAYAVTTVHDMAQAFQMPEELVAREVERLAATSTTVTIEADGTVAVGRGHQADRILAEIVALAEQTIATTSRVKKALV